MTVDTIISNFFPNFSLRKEEFCQKKSPVGNKNNKVSFRFYIGIFKPLVKTVTHGSKIVVEEQF